MHSVLPLKSGVTRVLESFAGLDEFEYFGRIKEIYELNIYGSKPLIPVIFKCHWFDPKMMRRTYSNLVIVEIRQDFTLPGDDVYIVAQ
jgi:hypothetical protein